MDTSHNSLNRVSVVPWLYWSLLPVHRLLLSLYFSQIIIQGFEHLPVNGPAIFAPKHYSRWDPVLLALLSLEPLWFMTNANQFGGVQGWFICRLGAFPIDLAHPRISSFRSAIALLQAGKKLVLFPEGGIVRNQALRPIKTGFARLVLQTESALGGGSIPVVPIAIRYQPSARWRAKVIIQILPPLYSKDYEQENEKQTAIVLTQAVQKSLLAGLQRIGVRADREDESIEGDKASEKLD
ncbi:1-acyl-sn-glycerol-3-phosphate acyltransferase [Leptolyngbyaceae cyanobacterium JSC-12]|nr:1-acyl-sn-glycerol-3-phosphate acyltransferase [Leptolyngbyaceae cyanobacterium JSC-12]